MAESNLYRIRPKFDYILFISVMILVIIGILMVYSSSYPISIKESEKQRQIAKEKLEEKLAKVKQESKSQEEFEKKTKDIKKELLNINKRGTVTYFFNRHIVFVIVGIIAMIISMIIPISFFRKYCRIFWFITIGLCLVPFFLPIFKGTYRWIKFHGFSLQPSDFLKVTSALYFPTILNNSKRSHFETFIVGTIYIAFNSGIVFLQRDLSTALVIAVVLVTMFFVTVLKPLETIGYIIATPVLVYIVASRGFRSDRLEAFKNPFAVKLDEAWQVIQSMYAVANGGFTGVGIGNSIQKYFYLYASYSDYAFAIVCEELGFVRAAFIMLLYIFVSLRFINHSRKMIDTFSSTFLIAVGTYIGVQSLIHMGVVCNALPSTGITLPFISYGGTSILSFLILVGIGFNILIHSPRKEIVKG